MLLCKDGGILIMDTDELADTLDLNLITVEEAKYALRTLDSLLKHLRGEFKKLQTPINQAEIAYSSSII